MSDGMGQAAGTQKQGKGGIGPGRFPGAGKCGRERVSYRKRSETDLQGQVRQKEELYSLDAVALEGAKVSKCKFRGNGN